MDTFALGRAFQAAGSDMGIATQIQYNQAMSQQEGAQKLQAQSAHDNFMQNLQAQRDTANANMKAAELGQQRSEFNQSLHQKGQAITNTKNYQNERAGTANRLANSTIQVHQAEIKKLNSQATAAVNGKLSLPELYRTANETTMAINKLNTGTQSLGQTKAQQRQTAQSIAALTANLGRINALINSNHTGGSSPGGITTAPQGWTPPHGTPTSHNPTTGQVVYYVNGQWMAAPNSAQGAPSGAGSGGL